MKSSLLATLLLFMSQLPAVADTGAPADLDIRFEHYYTTYTLNEDRSHVETHDWSKKILKERAVAGAKKAYVTYSTSIQKAEVLHAYTRKADGRRIQVPKDNYQVEVNRGQGKDSPVFSDRTTLTVIFPDVAVGDAVAFSYKVIQREAMFPGHFSVTNFFPLEYAYDDVRMRIDAPASIWAQHAARGMNEKISEQRGRKTLEWTFQNKEPQQNKRRNYSVYELDDVPGVSYSTFRSYEEIARAYGARATPKAAVTERVRQLANEITGDRTDPRAQAHVLYDWVAKHISYAGNCIGVGAVVPHDIPFILDNRMGDCKDHATLLQALYAAKGIVSAQALVNAGNAYRLPKIPVASNVNHVINYIPNLDLYVDSTAESTPFGLLPFQVADKPVLLVEGHRDGAKTPALAFGTNRQSMKTIVKIAADGSASGTIEVDLQGMFAVNTRAWMRHMPKDREDELVANALRGTGFIGSGKIDKDDPTALIDSHRFKVSFDIKDFVSLPGAGAFPIRPLLSTEAPVYRFLAQAQEPDEAVNVSCSNGSTIEEYRFEFPKGMKILSIPDNTSFANEILSYRATYKLAGNTLNVTRTVEDRTRGNVCTPDTTRTFKAIALKALSNMKAQVVYK
jgi:Domain of Unknown Function with PDB structure (DUF3857)/Transglutaminase-like superfamily